MSDSPYEFEIVDVDTGAVVDLLDFEPGATSKRTSELRRAVGRARGYAGELEHSRAAYILAIDTRDGSFTQLGLVDGRNGRSTDGDVEAIEDRWWQLEEAPDGDADDDA